MERILCFQGKMNESTDTYDKDDDDLVWSDDIEHAYFKSVLHEQKRIRNSHGDELDENFFSRGNTLRSILETSRWSEPRSAALNGDLLSIRHTLTGTSDLWSFDAEDTFARIQHEGAESYDEVEETAEEMAECEPQQMQEHQRRAPPLFRTSSTVTMLYEGRKCSYTPRTDLDMSNQDSQESSTVGSKAGLSIFFGNKMSIPKGVVPVMSCVSDGQSSFAGLDDHRMHPVPPRQGKKMMVRPIHFKRKIAPQPSTARRTDINPSEPRPEVSMTTLEQDHPESHETALKETQLVAAYHKLLDWADSKRSVPVLVVCLIVAVSMFVLIVRAPEKNSAAPLAGASSVEEGYQEPLVFHTITDAPSLGRPEHNMIDEMQKMKTPRHDVPSPTPSLQLLDPSPSPSLRPTTSSLRPVTPNPTPSQATNTWISGPTTLSIKDTPP
jgi:hypothetical protein